MEAPGHRTVDVLIGEDVRGQWPAPVEPWTDSCSTGDLRFRLPLSSRYQINIEPNPSSSRRRSAVTEKTPSKTPLSSQESEESQPSQPKSRRVESSSAKTQPLKKEAIKESRTFYPHSSQSSNEPSQEPCSSSSLVNFQIFLPLQRNESSQDYGIGEVKINELPPLQVSHRNIYFAKTVDGKYFAADPQPRDFEPDPSKRKMAKAVLNKPNPQLSVALVNWVEFYLMRSADTGWFWLLFDA